MKSVPAITRNAHQTTQRYAHVDADPALKAANEIGTFITTTFAPKKRKAATKRPRKKADSEFIEIV